MDTSDQQIFFALTTAIDDHVVDPRADSHSLLHSLLDLVSLVILGTICGAKSYEDIVQWAQGHLPWLQGFLELNYGVPSASTMKNVFERIHPADLEDLFVALTCCFADLGDELVSLDGKVFRGACAKSAGGKQLLVLNAWANEHKLVIGQHLVEEGHNEITDLPVLIAKLPLKGAHVTIDAIGTQLAIASALREAGADYTLIAKNNQPELRRQIHEFFEWQIALPKVNESRVEFGVDEEWDKGHGRIECRKVFSYSGEKLRQGKTGLPRVFDFEGAQTIVRLERERHLDSGVESEVHYYISTRPGDTDKDAAFINRAIRSHWGVENKVHWVLDMSFNEDARQVKNRMAAYNLGIIRRLSLNLVRQETSLGKRVPLRTRMFRASFDRGYLAKILAQAHLPGVHAS